MLQRVTIDGIEIPRLYMAENNADAMLAKKRGIPFIRWNRGQDELIKLLLRPVLESMFPHIKWAAVLGPKRRFRTTVEVYETEASDQSETVGRLDEDIPTGLLPDDGMVIDRDDLSYHVGEDGILTELSEATTGERLFNGHSANVQKLSLLDYMGDMSSCVNIEVLQRLRLMPAFIGDILDCIKINIGSGMYWREGYNKRLGIPVGRFDSSRQLPNLVILDISGSIPRGISATMISLIDTLRTQLSADLIITSTTSRFYPMNSKLPSPERIRSTFGFGNESYAFMKILAQNIRGKHYGHVFSFGDNDTPDYEQMKYDYNNRGFSLIGTKVECVHHYHTGSYTCYNTEYNDGKADAKTGYAKWCHMLAHKPEVEFDTSWCKVIKE